MCVWCLVVFSLSPIASLAFELRNWVVGYWLGVLVGWKIGGKVIVVSMRIIG